MTPEQKLAREAIGRLGEDAHYLQTLASQIAVKALIAAHPNKDIVRQYYDQLLGQLIASGAGHPNSADNALVLHDITATLFAPPVKLDT